MENYMTSETREKPMTKTRSLVYCALFTALIAVGAFIKIPIPVVPFTLQYLFTMLAGILLGSRLGSLSVLAYMILGLIGLPIFFRGWRNRLCVQTKFWLYYWFLRWNFCDRLACGTHEKENHRTLSDCKSRRIILCVCSGNDLLLRDLQLCD